MLYDSRPPAPPLRGFIERLWSCSNAPAHRKERINGQVPGPDTGTLYPIIIATDWADDNARDIRVTVVVHDHGARQFGFLAADFVKTPDPAGV